MYVTPPLLRSTPVLIDVSLIVQKRRVRHNIELPSSNIVAMHSTSIVLADVPRSCRTEYTIFNPDLPLRVPEQRVERARNSTSRPAAFALKPPQIYPRTRPWPIPGGLLGRIDTLFPSIFAE